MDTERIRSLLEEAERILDPVRNKVSAAYGDLQTLVKYPLEAGPGVEFEVNVKALQRNLGQYAPTLPEAETAMVTLAHVLEEYNQLTKE